jgi:hypothetical protein
MEFVAQKLDDILSSLRPLTVEWQDETARRVIDRLKAIHVKQAYTTEDIKTILDENFDDGMLICRLFLGLSKDQFGNVLRDALGNAGIGVKSYRAKPEVFLEALLGTGLLEAMAEEANRKPHWTDVLVERLRSGRGSAIAGQRRGRELENFVEAIVRKVFSGSFQMRCPFSGPRGTAKCDFAIPSKSAPRILIESKGYNATGSKMEDVTGDIEKIIAAKRPDTALLFFTDGLTWKQRKSTLRTIVRYQNDGDITRIYTLAMADQFEKDLQQLKSEYRL